MSPFGHLPLEFKARPKFRTTYAVTCSNCNTAVTGETYYTDDAMRDVLLKGIADSDIRREALSFDGFKQSQLLKLSPLLRARRLHVMPTRHRPLCLPCRLIESQAEVIIRSKHLTVVTPLSSRLVKDSEMSRLR